jgi:hypothetical protein
LRKTREAHRILQVDLKRKNIGYKELSRALENVCGIEIDSKSLSNKVGRGTCSFAFFLQCMKTLGVTTFNLRD